MKKLREIQKKRLKIEKWKDGYKRDALALGRIYHISETQNLTKKQILQEILSAINFAKKMEKEYLEDIKEIKTKEQDMINEYVADYEYSISID